MHASSPCRKSIRALGVGSAVHVRRNGEYAPESLIFVNTVAGFNLENKVWRNGP